MEENFWFPPGFDPHDAASAGPPGRGMIVNETDLPDGVVQQAVETYIEANASVLGVNGTSTFQMYANEGWMMNRGRWRAPGNVMEEIAYSRDIAERDDDVASTIGAMIATALEGGFLHTHVDEVTVALFDEIADHADLEAAMADMYRELLISSSVTTVSLFMREPMQFQPDGADRQRSRTMSAPLVGILPAEQVYVLDNDMFRRGTLAYRPATSQEERFLLEFFNDKTSPGRKAQMRAQDPVLTSLVVGTAKLDFDKLLLHGNMDDPPISNTVFLLNKRMVHRSTFPKGSWKYPRPLLTRNFPLLEAKRLLNIMDYALLQGGANFLIVAKKGSDQKPAMPEEVANLHQVIRSASRTGVIVGDHRLNIEIITPKLDELLNAEKRKLVGRKLAMALLRVPESGVDASGQEGQRTETEILSRVITSDRRLIKRHLERFIYDEVVTRNPGDFPKGPACIWFPKIVLQGTQFFTDFVLKLRDRGDISRQSTVEAGGFDYKAEVQQRKREKAAGDDRTLTPPPVPFTGQGGGPQDNGGGRPPGGSPANGRPGSQPQRSTQDPARPTRPIARNAGETVRAMWEDETGTYAIGEITYLVLDAFNDSRKIGRLNRYELRALGRIASGEIAEPIDAGAFTVIPVNTEYEVDDVRAVRLPNGASILVGRKADDDAIVARALSFRKTEYTQLQAELTALEWGFEPRAEEPDNS